MRQITAAPNTFVVVDGNNVPAPAHGRKGWGLPHPHPHPNSSPSQVRGRVGFCLGKGELSALLATWAERHQLSEQVVDLGPHPNPWALP